MSRKNQPGDGRFAALASLAESARRHDGRPAPDRLPLPAASAKEVEESEDWTLFRRSLGGVSRLKADNHAELERTRPAPMPRPKNVEPEPESAMPVRPLGLLEAAYQGVTPLRESGRVELPTGYRAHTARAAEMIQEAEQPARLLTTFEQAVLGATPLPDTGRLHLKPEPPPAIPRQKERNEKEVLRESLEAPITFEDRLDMGEEAAFLRPGLPRRILSDLRRGRWVVQRELDLHGLKRDEAREALGAFLGKSLKDGLRCLRLIHGKGLGSPGGEPVLKHLSKSWLSQREEILAFCQARLHDGGAGALLILLRGVKRET